MRQAGGCLCGSIRYTVEGEPDRVVHCHCGMCRRQSGAAFLTFARFSRASVRFDAGSPDLYRSSDRVVRGFCARCGSTLTFDYGPDDDGLWLTAGSLDRPELLGPGRHFMERQRVPWVCLDG